MGGFAWVTLATNDSYSLGALVLAHSLRRVGAKHDLAVLVTPGVTDVMREKLAAVFSLVQEVNVLDSKDETNLALLARPELGITFTKLHCWRLTQYEKCVFLDADTLVIRNCDELFEREELSAAPDVGWPDCFNSGVFVFKPSQQTFASITAFAAAKGSFDGGDQGLLNSYFSDWAHKDISKHLPFIYNMCSTATYSYLPAFKQFGEDVRIIHFIGAAKPWLQYFDTVTGIVQPPPDCNHLQPLLQNWWNIFCEHVHPQLSPVMTGLAGALAKLTLGEARSPEQIAFEEHMRKQSWEQGQIDYMGRDSFENIWKKILETLSRPPQKQKSPPKEVDEATASKETTKTETSETASTEPEEQTADLLSVIATETLSEKPVSTSVAETAPKVPGPPLDPVPPAQSSTGTPKTPEVGEPSPGVEGLLEASGAPSPEEPSAPKTETVEKSSESATTDLKQPSSEVPAETRPVPVGPPLEPFTSSADKEITAEPTSPTSTAVALKQPSAVIASPHPFAGIALGQASSETPRHLTDEPARTTAETAPPKAEAIAAKVPEEARESGDSPRQRMSFDAALESTAASILEQTLPRDISAVRPSAAGAEEGPIEAATPRAPESSGTSASVVPGSSEELPSPGKIIPEAPVTKEVDTVRETARVDPPAPAVTPEVARIDAVPSATVEPAGVVESVESPVPIQVAESVLQADLKESVSEDAKPVGEEALSSVVAPVQESATAVSETLIEPLDRPTSSDGTADVPVGSINGVDGDLPAINGLASGPTSPTTAEGVEVVPPTRPVVPVGTERSEEEQETTRSVVESEEAKKSALVESAAEVAVLESKSPESRVGAADVPSTPVSSSPRSSSSSADSATVESPVRPTRTKEIKIPATPTVTEPTPPTSPPVEGDGAEAQPKTTKKTTKKVVKKSSTEQEPSDSAEADPSGKKTVKKVAKKVAKKPKEAEDGAEGSAVASKPKTVAKSAKKVSTKPSESLEVDKSVPETPPAGNAEVPVPPKRKVKNSGPAKAPSKTDSEQ
ncbi:titin isoform X2 [Orussus abietinus]|uniref:titin isoform X2 n=1 Tax=Orussus abietinus TaxID=222816 RepID=UPI0006264F8C|nr:titin isoform X2 [Orussus abietinus]